MSVFGRCVMWLAACAGLVFAFRLLRNNHDEKQTDKSALHDWENEGGNLAPAAVPSDTGVPKSQPEG